MKFNIIRLILFFLLLQTSNNIFSQLVLNFNISNTTCQSKGGHNLDGNNIGSGIIRVTASGGTKPYTYGISGNHTYTRTQNNGYFPQLYLGNYTITVIDNLGLRKDTVITITSNLPIPSFVKPAALNPSICQSTNGRIIFPTPDSGKFPFLYSIDGGATFSQDSIFNNLKAGFYMCKVIDGNNCMSFYWPISLYDTIPCEITATQLKVKTACGNDAEPMVVNFYNKIDSVIAYSFDSVHFTPLIGNYSSGFYRVDSFANLGPGIHNLFLKDSVHNIRNTAIINIAKSCELYIQFLSVDASCGGSDGALTINASGGTAPYSYTIDGSTYQTSNTITGLTSGSYTITVKDASGALSSAIGTIFNKCPVVSFTKYNDTCGSNGGKIIASAIKGVTPYLFSIDDKNYQSNNSFIHLPPGNYKVYVKDANNFKDSSIITRIIPTCIVNTTIFTNEFCNNHYGSITLKTSGGTKPYSAMLMNNNGLGQSINYTDSIGTTTWLVAGKYTIRIYDFNGATYWDSIEILNIVPPINLGSDTTLCEGKTMVLAPNLTAAQLTWQDNSKDNTFQVTKSGTYWVTAKLPTCTLVDTITINYLLFNNKIFPNKDTTICTDSSIVLNAKYSGANYLWNDNSTTQLIKVSIPGQYWDNVKVNGCTLSDTIYCKSIKGPQIFLPKDTSFCLGNSLVLDPGNKPTSFLWSTNETSRTIKVTKSGNYWLAAKALGCTTIDTVQVIGHPIPKINLGNDTTLCKDSSLLLDVSKLNAIYKWQDGSINSNYLISQPGNYWVNVTQNGCDTTAKIFVNYLTKPSVNLGLDSTLCTLDQFMLDAKCFGCEYLWQDGSTTPTYIVKKEGIYSVEAKNICGVASDSVIIKYKNCICNIDVPNAFSPNGDGVNDDFRPSISCVTSFYHLAIFNRYGQPVFDTFDQLNYWKGTYQEKPLPIGTYYYILKVKSASDDIMKMKSGGITILR